jgi:molybdate/tungstate transport system permease protein
MVMRFEPLRSAFAWLILALLAAPFLALITGTDWPGFHLSAADADAIGVSLGLNALSLALIVLLGTPVAAWLAAPASPGRAAGRILVLLPLLTPPLALGILLATFYGGITDGFHQLGVTLTNNRAAFVLAGLYAGMPTYIVAARAALAGVPEGLKDVARSLGLSPASVFFRITLKLARTGIAAGLALAWVRTVGELGIVLIIAYFPQGMPIRLWVDLQDQGVPATFPLLLAFLAAALPLPLWLLSTSTRS